jgi:hypothetical protein
MFISRNPQSVAFHGGRFGQAAPDTQQAPSKREKRNAQ